MSDGRTPEQEAADEALSAAIQNALEAYGFQQEGHITTSWMVLVGQRGWADGHEGCSTILKLYKDGSLDWVTIFGLLRTCTMQAEQEFYHAERDEM